MKKKLFACFFFSVIAQAQVASLNEDFTNFPVDQFSNMGGAYGTLPYQNWSASKPYPNAFVTQHSTSGNKYLKAYTLFDAQSPIYFFTPELISVEGNLTFYAGGSGGGSIQVGVIEDKDNLQGFQPLRTVELQDALVKYTLDIPSKTAKYIAFKCLPNGAHQVFGLDNVIFTPKELSTREINKQSVKLALTKDGFLKVMGGQWSLVKLYNAGGSLVLNTKVLDNRINVSALSRGVYFITLENEAGHLFQTKFVK